MSDAKEQADLLAAVLSTLTPGDGQVAALTPPCPVCGKHAGVALTSQEAIDVCKTGPAALVNRDSAFKELFASGLHEHCRTL